MKNSVRERLAILLAATFLSHNVYAIDLTGTQTYVGKVQSAAVGFYGHIGVGLQDGTTCQGQSVAVLLTTNPKYKEILSLLYVAETTQSDVKFYALASVRSDFGVGYCVIGEASLGRFALW